MRKLNLRADQEHSLCKSSLGLVVKRENHRSEHGPTRGGLCGVGTVSAAPGKPMGWGQVTTIIWERATLTKRRMCDKELPFSEQNGGE